MPHVIVKLYPGRSEVQKTRLAERIVEDVMTTLNSAEESVSVAILEVTPEEWIDEVYTPDITDNWQRLYKKPGYDPLNLK